MDDQRRIVAVLLLTAVFGWAQIGVAQTATCDVNVDFSRAAGTIRHLNGVNDGPLCPEGRVDLSSYYKKLGIECVRMNGYGPTLNMKNVFSRFEADPDQPDNYDFFHTDWYVKAIEALGIRMIYGLGGTAEKPDPRRGGGYPPPKNFEKWAQICAHVIKHYNNGWDNGYHYNIRYWEIWNEPNAPFWAGTPEQYYKFYEIAAKAIKNYDPNLKVGGPALAPGGNSLPFLKGFLEYCHGHKVPLDFVSWHMYTTRPEVITRTAARVRELLNKYGFPNAESVLDEWAYYPGKWGQHTGVNVIGDPEKLERWAQEVHGISGAAFDAKALMMLQDTTVNIANFYSGTTQLRWGLFNGFGVPHKTYYAFKAFKFLLDTPVRVAAGGFDGSGIAAIAGLSHDKTQATLMISNYGTECGHYTIRLENLPWKGGTIYEKYALDKDHDLDLVKTETLVGTSATLPERVDVPSVCLIRLKASSAK